METITIGTLTLGFCYSGWASIRAYRESGAAWILFLPQWIDASSGVSAVTRRHGMASFAILLVGFALFISE